MGFVPRRLGCPGLPTMARGFTAAACGLWEAYFREVASGPPIAPTSTQGLGRSLLDKLMFFPI